jgi:hypothetical protein
MHTVRPTAVTEDLTVRCRPQETLGPFTSAAPGPCLYQRLQGTPKPSQRNTGKPKVAYNKPTPSARMISSSSAGQCRQAQAPTAVGTPPIKRTKDWKFTSGSNDSEDKEVHWSISVNLVANSRLGIVNYPRNIRRESGATRSLRTLWVPEEDTRILLLAST